MSRYAFLADTYDTERLKTLSVWTDIPQSRMHSRPEPKARTPLEHMVHQCLSEDGWMTNMLGLPIDLPALPTDEGRDAFVAHYAACSSARLSALHTRPDEWFEHVTMFFDVPRSRAWILTRRIAHSAHHRGQLTAYLRHWGAALFSTYGPTADTGGLPKNGARVIYKYASLDDLLESVQTGRNGGPVLPGPGLAPPTERGT
jgi:uncharacterized damage-inducible protein DinB